MLLIKQKLMNMSLTLSVLSQPESSHPGEPWKHWEEDRPSQSHSPFTQFWWFWPMQFSQEKESTKMGKDEIK